MLRCAALIVLTGYLSYAAVEELAIEHYTLPNGMEAIFHVDHKSPIVHFNLRFRAGSKDDPPGRSGLAHLFEHLLFHGVGAVQDYTIAAEHAGAIEASGSTDFDFTEYYDTVPSNLLERMLWMESNRFAQFLDGLTQEQLDRQRAVVINEKRQKNEPEPYWRADPLIRDSLFPAGHPYHHTPGGEYEDLRAITLEDVRNFYAQHYTADRVTIAMVGDFDSTQAKEWIEKYFGSMAPGRGLAEAPRYLSQLDAPRTVEVHDRVPTERVWFAWSAPAYASRDEAALNLAASILGAETSPLVKALNLKLSLGVTLDKQEWQDASIFRLIVSITPGSKLAEVEKTAMAELEHFAREGPKPEELERSKSGIELSQLTEMQSPSALARALLLTAQYFGSIDHWSEWRSRLTSLTADDVPSAVSRWLVGRNYITVHVTPLTATAGATPPPDRTQPPPLPPVKPYRLPAVQSARLPNGLTILVIELHDLPIVSFEFRVRAGSLASPPGKPIVAALAASLATKGTTTRNTAEILAEATRLAVDGDVYPELDNTTFGVDVVRRNLESAVHLTADIVRNPSYSADDLQQQKKVAINRHEKPEDPADFESVALAVAFGDQHPLAIGVGTSESIRSVTVQDLRDFHDRYFKPDAAVLVFSGDITVNDAVQIAADEFESWSGHAAQQPKLPTPAPKSGRLFLVDRKGYNQTMVTQVLPGVPRDSPDYPALLMARSVLGGILESRLRLNVRQEKGIAYYAISKLPTYPEYGLWEAYSQVQVDSTGVAIREFQKELAAITGSKPITAEELKAAKASLVHSVQGAYESNWSAAQQFAGFWTLRLPLDHDQLLMDRVSALTLAEVNAVVRKYGRPDRAIFVLLGDREKIEPQLGALGLGPVTVLK